MGQYQRGGSGERQRQPAEPKPFAFVPLPRLPRPINRSSPTKHDRYQQNRTTGRIHGTIKALTPIHVGSGIIDFGEHVNQQVELIKSAMRTMGEIVIPGSSLKGAIRSIVEAISESCVCKTKVSLRRRPLEQFIECKRNNRNERLCIACRMFGAMGYQGNIAIQDAPLIQGNVETRRVPILERPRLPTTDNQGRPMRKFYKHGEVATGETAFEACDVDSTFQFSVKIDNLSYAEWGLFFTALGKHPEHPFNLKIGGAKPRCFGSVDFNITEIHVDDQQRERYLQWDSQSDTVKRDDELQIWIANCCRSAWNSLIQRNQLQTLIEEIEPPDTNNCPERNY